MILVPVVHVVIFTSALSNMTQILGIRIPRWKSLIPTTVVLCAVWCGPDGQPKPMRVPLTKLVLHLVQVYAGLSKNGLKSVWAFGTRILWA
eukprot:SAG11_NODE_4935_length_1718_cov_1.360716_1_plen_91_part_00